MFLQSLLIALSLPAHGISGPNHPSDGFLPAIMSVAQQPSSAPPSSPPSRPPSPPPKLPPNRVRPGGGLNSAKQTCKASAQALTALIPVQNPVLTTTGHPTLLFYVPDSAADIRSGKFSIFTQDEKTRIYETSFTLPQAPGIVSIRLPKSPNYALEEGKSYHWYFKLYCQETDGTQADLVVNGWMQRVASTPERQRLIEASTPDIWYDAIATVAMQLQSQPQNPVLQGRWANLLRSLGMENLAAQPFAGSVILVDRRP